MSMFSELINPITPVGAGSKGSAMGNGLGEAADFVETLRKNRADEAHQQEQDALKEQHQLSTDRYYDSISGYHNALVNEKKQEDANKLLAGQQKSLMDLVTQHRVAQSKGDINGMQDIRNQIAALGGQVSESASALPDANAPAAGAPPPSLTPPPPGAWSTLKNGQDEPHAPGYGEGEPTPGGAPFLKNYMASQGVQASSRPAAGASAAISLLPGPEDIKPPAPPPPQGKGKFTIKDAKGNVLSEYDQPLEQAKTQNQVDQIIAPYTEGGTPESNQVWQQIRKSAVALAATNGISPKEAVEIASKNAGVELGQYKRKGPGGGGGEGVDEKHAFKVESAVSSVLKDEDARNKIATIKTDHSLLAKAHSLLEQGNGPAQTLAAIDLMRMMNGRAGNQAEFTALKGGPWMRFQSWVNGITDENAPMPQALVNDLRSAVDAADKTLTEHEAQVHDEARDVIETTNIPFRKGEKERALQRVDARLGGKSGVTPSQPNAETPEQKRARLLKAVE